MEFTLPKSKKSFIFAEMISELSRIDQEEPSEEGILYDHLFLINSLDPWYGNILVYLQTMHYPPNFSREEWRQLQIHPKNYFIIDNTLYHQGGDCILRHYLTHEEAEKTLNDFHAGACGGHLSGLETSHKILHAGYFWPSIFKDCVEAIKKCHPCQIYTKKMHAHPTLLHPVVIIGPYAKWGIDFMTCHLTSTVRHKYIIMAVAYFTKWVKPMPTFENDDKTIVIFMFNHIKACFGVLKEIVTDHGSHFQNIMMIELSTTLGFKQENSSPYYPQANGKVEVLNKSLNIMLQKMVDKNRSNWHIILYPAL